MNKNTTLVVKLLAVGMVFTFTLMSYGHSAFASKTIVDRIFDDLKIIKKHVYDINQRSISHGR